MRITLILISLFSLTLLIQEPKSVSIKTIEIVQRSVVPIVCAQIEPNKLKIVKVMGSGFFINRQGGAITAAHIMQTWDQVPKNEACVPAVYVPFVPWKNRIDNREIKAFALRTSCRANIGADIVYCLTIDNPFLDASVKNSIAPIALGNSAPPVDGTPIAFTGFPLEYFYPVTSKGYVAGYLPAAKQLIIDKSAWPGASGSPVYTADGKVIGMVIQAGVAHGSGLAYARPTNFILDFLQRDRVPIEK
jgi:S1-C subfamily serine protease